MAIHFDDIPVEPPPLGLRLLETLFFSLAIPAIGMVIQPDDPLLIQSGLPWLLIAAPLLIGIRYGFALGFSSALISVLLIGLDAWWRLGTLVPENHQVLYHAAAIVLVGMVSGEMADTWQRRVRQLAQLHRAQTLRLDEFIRHYHLLRVSHDKLVERMAGKPYNLRDTLNDLTKRFRHLAREGELLRRHGDELLAFLALNGHIQQAVLIRLDADEQPINEPLQCFGGRIEVALDHPMIQACLTQRRMISLRGSEDMPMRLAANSMLAVVPLIDVHDRLHALVTVTEMPFIDFHQGQLQLLAVLGAQLGDLLHDAEQGPDTTSEGDLKTSLVRWVKQAHRNKLTSLLITLRLPHEVNKTHGHAIVDQTMAQLRTLDQGWVTRSVDGGRCIRLLMPLSDDRSAAPFAERLWKRLAESPGIDARQEGIVMHHQLIDGKRSAIDLLAVGEHRESRHAHA